mmetsp:Transcript_11678/g.19366  ORF Transcript_11678/g.19366 Transcript_11678/m.19366 type:complete len:98 (+) Transcript_11678:3-296(+)
MGHYLDDCILWAVVANIIPEFSAHFFVPALLGLQPFAPIQLLGVAFASQLFNFVRHHPLMKSELDQAARAVWRSNEWYERSLTQIRSAGLNSFSCSD